MVNFQKDEEILGPGQRGIQWAPNLPTLPSNLERIGNGVGKQGYGNDYRPPIDDRNPMRKFSIDPLDASKTNGTTRPQLTHHGRESKRKADTEIQYRPRIVDTDIDCRPRFCGPRFRDSYWKKDVNVIGIFVFEFNLLHLHHGYIQFCFRI